MYVYVYIWSMCIYGVCATLWTVAHQACLSVGFSRQEHWSELPFPSPGDLPYPGIEPKSPVSPALQADSLPLYHLGSQDVDRPPLGCPPTPITVWSTDGEGDGWQSQNRAGSSSVYRKFSFTCHIKGDPRLHWGNENGSSGTHSQAGTRASSFGV